MNKIAFVAAALLASVAAVPAGAQTFFNNTTGLTAPGITVTFNEFNADAGTPITNQYAANGVTFTNAFLNPQDGFYARNYLGNYFVEQAPDFQVTFNALQTRAGFQLITNSGTSTINVFNGATLVATQTFSTDLDTSQFYGFTGATFNRIQLLAPNNNALQFDTLQFDNVGTTGAVPEPATWAMMMLGFGMVGYGLRRRAAKVSTRVAFA